MFVLLSRYTKPMEEVERWLSEHRAFLDPHYKAGRFLVSGPLEPRTGGAIVTFDMTRAEVEAILAADPFVREGVAEYEILEVRPTKRHELLNGRL